MITAKNYAAQVERAAAGSMPRDATLETKREVARLIPVSQHFAIPDGGKILNDGLRGIEDEAFRLPYDSITVSCFCDGVRYCTVAAQSEDTIVLFFAANFEREWEIIRWAATLDGVRQGEIGLKFLAHDGSMPREEAQPLLAFLALTVLELCEALSCSNVDSEVIDRVDLKKNEKRIKNGKLPMYETRRLVIKTTASKSEGMVRGCDTGRAGPREHLRRGHIRRLSDSRKVWVNSCVVGHRHLGVIEKRYEVVS